MTTVNVFIRYIKNGMAAFEEQNGDVGILSLYRGAPVEVGDELIIETLVPVSASS